MRLVLSLDRLRHTFPLQSIAWSPLTNLVAYTDNSTAFVLWDKPVPSSLPSPVDMSAAQGLALAAASQLSAAVEFENTPAAATPGAAPKAKHDDVDMTGRDNNDESDGGSQHGSTRS